MHGKHILIMRGVTIEQAQEWCGNERTQSKKDNWFDGYAETNTMCTNQNPKYTKYFNPEEL